MSLFLVALYDNWRWRSVRTFIERNRAPAHPDLFKRATDYIALADAFGMDWPRERTRVHALLRGFGDPDPRGLSAYICSRRP